MTGWRPTPLASRSSADRPTTRHTSSTWRPCCGRRRGSGSAAACPFTSGMPVLCDGTAQNNIGMSYSLQSRNAVAEMVVNQMEAHSYHGAFVVSGCDKTPLGIASGLAHLDRDPAAPGRCAGLCHLCPVARAARRHHSSRPDAPTWKRSRATAEAQDHPEIAVDLRETMQLHPAVHLQLGLPGRADPCPAGGLAHRWPNTKISSVRLAVHTCHRQGGICAFNGTGNSSRHVVTALGLTHPAVELLTGPPETAQVNQAVDGLFTFVNRPDYSVGSIVAANFANAVRIHSATGGSTNLMMHLVAAMIYAGYDVDVWTIDHIRRNPPVPDIFDYSLTEGRDIFALAQQCCAGQIRGWRPSSTSCCSRASRWTWTRPPSPARRGASGWPTRVTWLRRVLPTTRSSSPPPAAVQRHRGAAEQLLRVGGGQDQRHDQRAAWPVRRPDRRGALFRERRGGQPGLLDVHVLDRLSEHPALTRDKLLAMAAHNSRKASQQSADSTAGAGSEMRSSTGMVQEDCSRSWS